MEGKVKKVLVILADGFEEVEAFTPIDLLRRAGASVTVSGLEKRAVLGSHNIRVDADAVLLDLLNDDFDALVLPGGMKGAENLANSKDVSFIIKKLYEKGRLICAICASPAVVLSPLGILDEKNAVCYPGMEVKDRDINFKTDSVCLSENVITSRGLGTSVDFGLKIIQALYSEEEAKALAKKVCYNTEPMYKKL